MALRYPPQAYALYPTHHWPEDVKSTFPEDDDDRSLASSSPADVTGVPDSRRHSVKVEDDFNTGHMWHDRPHSQMAQMRHYSHPSIPTINTAAQPMGRLPEHTYHNYGPPQPWPMSAHSESSTPTPLYGAVQDPMPIQYASASANYPFQQPEPPSAVSMSPQSSQGGWASTTSSDGAEQRIGHRSPYPRPLSPMTVLRSDGIRKKNARFEIPKERNLANIDALIMSSTDELEKKELKQQKRLLRNRQAALDSRQRKKTHTEKLELEKKMFSSQKQEMEDVIQDMETRMNQEREQWMQQRQQYENFIQNLQYERDEAIRTKTLETGELRRQNNVLKDCVRELERQQATRGFTTSDAADNFNTDFSNFGNLDLEDNWDDGFSLINSDDLKMEGEDTPQRQLTPRPPPPTSELKSTKQETLISMNTLYMCLLFGAFFTSTNKDASSASSSNVATSIPDDYRTEAGNVFRALAPNQESSSDIPSQPAVLPTTISGHELSRMSHQPSSSLDNLAASLTTPTRHQQAASAFSLSAGSFSHITNPDGIMDSPSPEVGGTGAGIAAEGDSAERQPTRVESLFRAMQASRDDVDRVSGMGGKARERSVLLDRVPEKVLRDFREMVGMAEREKGGQ